LNAIAAEAGIVAGWTGNTLSPQTATAAAAAVFSAILSDVFLRLIR
jgi:hypothetical protein